MTFNTETSPSALATFTDGASATVAALIQTVGTLSELQAAIAAAEPTKYLSKDRRDEIANDIERFIELLPGTGRLPPSRKTLFDYFKRMRLAYDLFEISQQRARNLNASVRAAIRWLKTGRIKRRSHLSREWEVLRATLNNLPFSRAGLATLMAWCTDNEVMPEAVDDEVIMAFYGDMLDERGTIHGRSQATTSIIKWNELQGTHPGWPASKLSKLPRKAPVHTTEMFAAEFIKDLANYAATITNGGEADDFDEDNSATPPRAPRSDRTATNRVYALRIAAARLAKAQGVPLTNITALAQLFEKGAPTTIMKVTRKEAGKGPTERRTIDALVDVAKHYVKAEAETMIRLGNLNQQTFRVEMEMTEANRRILRDMSALDMHRLLTLPRKLMAQVNNRLKNRLRLRESDIRAARAAVYLAIELYTPLRISNLAQIRLGENLMLPDHLGGTARFAFTRTDMKSKRPWGCAVHEESLPVIRWYLAKVRPHLGGDPLVLFPGEKGALQPQSVRRDIYLTMLEHVRAPFHPHFFRHLAAHRLLVAEPGNYDGVAKLLDHKNTEVTRAFYCGEEADAALQHVAHLLSASADQIAMEAEVESRAAKRMPKRSSRRKA